MNPSGRKFRSPVGILSLGLMLWALGGWVRPAAAQNLDELLTQVGENYAEAYASPFLYTFGPNANSNMFSTARIPRSRLVFGVGIKAMGTQIDPSDQVFAKWITNVDLHAYDATLPVGTMGNVLLSGPTIFGDTAVNGHVRGYVDGVELLNVEAIPGLLNTTWSPLAAPEAYVGGIMGLKATVRYLPSVSAGDLGNTKYWGYGLQWSLNTINPGVPVDVMVGFFTQEINVGTVYTSTAQTMFVGASKSLPLLTLYGGFASEKSQMTVNYDFVDPNDPALNSHVGFSVDGIQRTRFTLGMTLDVLAKVNFEAGFGSSLTTYSAGLMFGL